MANGRGVVAPTWRKGDGWRALPAGRKALVAAGAAMLLLAAASAGSQAADVLGIAQPLTVLLQSLMIAAVPLAGIGLIFLCIGWIAVGTLIAERPPHRAVRAAFPHTAPTSGVWRRTASPAKDEGSAVSGASPPPAPWSAARWSCPSGCAAAASGARGSRHGCGRPRGPDRWSAPRGS